MYSLEEVRHIHEERCDILQRCVIPDIFINPSVQIQAYTLFY